MAGMEGTITFGGRTVEVVDIDDWDFDELAAAENAFAVDIDDARTAQKIMFAVFISIRRHDKTTPVGALADQVRRMKFSSAIRDKVADGEPDPLGDGGGNGAATPDVRGVPATTGSRPSDTGST